MAAAKKPIALLRRKHAAAQLGVSEKTIVRYVERGWLRETRIKSAAGHRSMPRYQQVDLEAFVLSGYTR